MKLQYLQDEKGNTTSVLVPIDDWKSLISRIDDLQTDASEEIEISDAQKKILDERLDDYRKNPDNNLDFEDTLVKIRKQYSL